MVSFEFRPIRKLTIRAAAASRWTFGRFVWWAHGVSATYYSFLKEECGHEAQTPHVFFCCSAIGDLGPMAGRRVIENRSDVLLIEALHPYFG
jgi:hypothetical protein